MKIKNFLVFSAVLTLALFVSCDNHDQTKTEAVVGQIKIDPNALRLGDVAQLFTYTTSTSLNSQLPAAVLSLMTDANSEMAANSAITNVVMRIKFSGGKAILSEVYYLNNSTRVVIDGLIYDFTNHAYVAYSEDPVPIDWGSIANGSCPSGWSSVGSCSNTGGTSAVASCVAAASQTFLSANITGIGSCAQIKISVGVLSTKICGKTC